MVGRRRAHPRRRALAARRIEMRHSRSTSGPPRRSAAPNDEPEQRRQGIAGPPFSDSSSHRRRGSHSPSSSDPEAPGKAIAFPAKGQSRCLQLPENSASESQSARGSLASEAQPLTPGSRSRPIAQRVGQGLNRRGLPARERACGLQAPGRRSRSGRRRDAWGLVSARRKRVASRLSCGPPSGQWSSSRKAAITPATFSGSSSRNRCPPPLTT